MNYAKWIKEQYAIGVPIEHIAEKALRGPVLQFGNEARMIALIEKVALALGVEVADIHVVGSSRYGFSLHDRAVFHPLYSDLDLAVVDSRLHERCASSHIASSRAIRFPETDLPFDERVEISRFFDDLSRSVAQYFAYVSVAVFSTTQELVRAQAGRIAHYLGIIDRGSAVSLQSSSASQLLSMDLSVIAEAGLPKFMASVAASNPTNSSPWLANRACFTTVFGNSDIRLARLAALEQAFKDLSNVIDVQCCLVGGSFLDISNPAPNDLDILVFYRSLPECSFNTGRTLQRLSRRFLLERIDMRFAPCDAEPWLLVKLTSFFTTLYQSQRPSAEAHSRGLVLLIPESPC